jgi:hypothetical protein
MTKLVNPTPLFLDGRGALLDAGYVYIGTVNTNPETVGNQLALFWDSAMTIPAAQPLRTLGGVIVNGVTPSFVYFAATDYSMTVRDVDSVLVTSIPSCTETGGVTFQPLDDDLTAISGLGIQVFGRDLLTLTSASNMRVAAGLGSAATFDETTSAQFRNNTASKILTTDKVWGAAAAVALTPGATVSIDLSTGFNFTLAMGGNYTLSNPTNAKAGQEGAIEITQDATGSRTLTYGANWLFSGGVDPALSTAANSKDVLFYKVLANGTSVLGALVKGIA